MAAYMALYDMTKNDVMMLDENTTILITSDNFYQSRILQTSMELTCTLTPMMRNLFAQAKQQETLLLNVMLLIKPKPPIVFVQGDSIDNTPLKLASTAISMHLLLGEEDISKVL